MRLAALSALGVCAPFRSWATDVHRKVKSVSLKTPDQNGFSLLPGYQSRLIAESGKPPVKTSAYLWHDAPDGGATMATADGGWIYISNSEVSRNRGGVGAIRFSAAGVIIKAYSLLTGTSRNCAGNMTPWGSYLSCEESSRGRVWECDPLAIKKAVARPKLGRFIHESVVVEPQSQQLYLTEDRPDGCLYRFTPAKISSQAYPDLDQGVLEVASITRQKRHYSVRWLPLPDPLARRRPTRYQLKNVATFHGGEGICYLDGRIFFTTKGDNRVWALDVKKQFISVLYDDNAHTSAVLRGVDNIIAMPDGRLLISEDGGDMQLVSLSLSGQLQVFLQLHGHPRSELTGLAFSPDGRRLYVSSQRGVKGQSSAGIVYEISRKN